MGNQKACTGNGALKFGAQSNIARSMFVLAFIGLGLLACQISSLPAVPNVPSIFGPTATPPSAQSILSKAVATLRDAKTLRIQTTLDQPGQPTIHETIEFVAPDKEHIVPDPSHVCKNNEISETLIVGTTVYQRCGQASWGMTEPTSSESVIEGIAALTSSCVPRGSVGFTKLGSDDEWIITTDCVEASGGGKFQGTVTYFVDPHNYQLRKLIATNLASGTGITATDEFSAYNDSSIAINEPAQANIATAAPNILPDAGKASIMQTISQSGSWQVRNVQIDVKGSGKVLPFERQSGVDTVICVTVRYELFTFTSQWMPRVDSGLVTRTGNLWQWQQILSLFSGDWDAHSCPGTFESSP